MTAALLTGCGSDSGADNPSSAVDAKPCPSLARADEMRLKVVRSDRLQMTELTAMFQFEDGAEEWLCSKAIIDGILCEAAANWITIIAPLGDAGEIRSVELVDRKGYAYSGPVEFEWETLPVSYRCSTTYRRGIAAITLTQ